MREPEQSFIRLLNALAQPIIFSLFSRPEGAHEIAIKLLKTFAKLPWRQPAAANPRLAINAFSLNFPHPLGLGAGFDKNGEAVDAMFRLDFGFTEVGTITPKPQEGNPGNERVQCLVRDQAAINWLGFPSQGHKAVHERLAKRAHKSGIVGINLGANKDTSDRVDDYVRGIAAFADVADYFTINISSPNTPGLRDLQKTGALDDLLARVLAARDEQIETFGRKPVLLKIAPDLTLAELDEIVKRTRSQKIDGMIVSNTTVSRPASLDSSASKQGGLSGRPLFGLSTQKLASTYLRVENQFPLIGVGGIESAETVLAKIEAGATLVQLCTSFVFKGLTIADEINSGLLRLLDQKSYPRLADATGAAAADWASGKLNADNFR